MLVKEKFDSTGHNNLSGIGLIYDKGRGSCRLIPDDGIRFGSCRIQRRNFNRPVCYRHLDEGLAGTLVSKTKGGTI